MEKQRQRYEQLERDARTKATVTLIMDQDQYLAGCVEYHSPDGGTQEENPAVLCATGASIIS